MLHNKNKIKPLGKLWWHKKTVCVLLFKNFYVIFFYNCIVPIGFLPWEIRVAFPEESQLRESCATKSTVHAGCFSVSMIHRTLTGITGSLTCAQIGVNACDCSRGCTDTVNESLHWKLTLGGKSLASPGNRTCISGVPVRRSNNWRKKLIYVNTFFLLLLLLLLPAFKGLYEYSSFNCT